MILIMKAVRTPLEGNEVVATFNDSSRSITSASFTSAWYILKSSMLTFPPETRNEGNLIKQMTSHDKTSGKTPTVRVDLLDDHAGERGVVVERVGALCGELDERFGQTRPMHLLADLEDMTRLLIDEHLGERSICPDVVLVASERLTQRRAHRIALHAHANGRLEEFMPLESTANSMRRCESRYLSRYGGGQTTDERRLVLEHVLERVERCSFACVDRIRFVGFPFFCC